MLQVPDFPTPGADHATAGEECEEGAAKTSHDGLSPVPPDLRCLGEAFFLIFVSHHTNLFSFEII